MTCSLSCFDKYSADAPLILRLFLGGIFLFAGLGKIFVITAPKFAGMLSFLPVPLFWAWLVIFVETIGGVLLILGLWVRWVSIFAAINMAVASGFVIKMQDLATAFSPLACFAMSIALLILGAGAWSLERKAFGKEC